MLKMNFPASLVQKLQPEQTDTQTDLTEIITYLHTQMVNISIMGRKLVTLDLAL